MTTEYKIAGVRLCVWQRQEMRNANGPFVLAYHPYRIEKGMVVTMAGREDDGHTRILPGEYATCQEAQTALQAVEQTTIEY